MPLIFSLAHDILEFYRPTPSKTPMTSFSRVSTAHARQTKILADEQKTPWSTRVHRWSRRYTYIIRCVLTSTIQYTHRTNLYAAVKEIKSLSSRNPIESREPGSDRLHSICTIEICLLSFATRAGYRIK